MSSQGKVRNCGDRVLIIFVSQSLAAVRDRAVDVRPTARRGDPRGCADLAAAATGFVELGLGDLDPASGLVQRPWHQLT